MESFGGSPKITGNCFDRNSSPRSSDLDINCTLSKQEAWFNQTATPNSGFGEFEPNFAAIMGCRLVGCHLPHGITNAMAKAPDNVLCIMVGVIMTGAVLLLPTLGYLFMLFKSHPAKPKRVES